MYEKYQLARCSKYDKEHEFDVILESGVPCLKQASQQFLSRYKNFDVASEVTLHHSCKTLKHCKSITCEVLRHVATFFIAFV